MCILNKHFFYNTTLRKLISLNILLIYIFSILSLLLTKVLWLLVGHLIAFHIIQNGILSMKLYS